VFTKDAAVYICGFALTRRVKRRRRCRSMISRRVFVGFGDYATLCRIRCILCDTPRPFTHCDHLDRCIQDTPDVL
jgi:hypothetical protein